MNDPPGLCDERADRSGDLAALSGRIICKLRDLHNTELNHETFCICRCLLALAVAAATPVRADYAVVRFETGSCQIWGDTSATPWGVNWTKVAMTPDWASANSALYAAIAARTCN